MAKWVLVWMLTVQTYDGEVDTRVIEMPMDSRTTCMQEADSKLKELELQLGKDYYFNYNYEKPVKLPLGGTLLGVSVECKTSPTTESSI